LPLTTIVLSIVLPFHISKEPMPPAKQGHGDSY
jgi:hypothetical protein